MGTTTPLKDRLDRIREKREAAPRIVQLYPSEPTTLSPFVRMAREARLRPTALDYSPDGCGPTGRAA